MDIPRKAEINYSLKNIPVPSQNTYMKKLIVQVEKVLQRIRWKTFFFLNPSDKPQQEKYGFKTPHNAPQCRELINFESDVTHLVANVEFRESKCSFQRKLKKDVNYINKSKNIFVKADKTSNVYEVSKDTYNKYLHNNITAHYCKADKSTENSINLEAKHITEKLKISDRVEPIAHQEAYVTIKDHKEGFPNNVKCRLINPAKSNIGKISKLILEEINEKIRDKFNLNQWRSTRQALDWFNSVTDKKRKTFLLLDICDFYPSISEDLFNKAIDFAADIVPISVDERQILTNARKSLLFSDNETWQKKTGLHDVTMGSFDGCELCELVGLLILKKMSDSFPELNFGLYRDDGLAIHKRIPGPRLERIKKDIINLFHNFGLKITIETGLFVVNFLDTTLNLKDETHAPYRKPNDTPLYINTKSNHPRSVINQIKTSVEKRLNEISSSENIFNLAKNDYEKALKDSGHNSNLIFNPDKSKQTKKKRKRRNEIWFNPPFSKNVKTDIGRQFLRLIDKNFPKNNPLNEILNRKTIKMSYSCTENVEQILNRHNKRLLNTEEKDQGQRNTNLCNCKVKTSCPVDNKCLTESVIYKATVEPPTGGICEYIGLTDNTFKTRYNLHKHTFKNQSKRSATALASYIWDSGIQESPPIKWTILKECRRYTPGQKTCQLCLSEKLFIVKNLNNPSSLNKRSDIGNKCYIHRKKHFLNHIT